MTRRKRSKRPARRQTGRAPSATQKPVRTSVILTALNEPGYTKLCVESLFRHTPSDEFELVVVDNGSQSPTRDYLASLPARIVRFDENRGIAAAWNAGARVARGSYLAFVDNDVLFGEGWLPPLREAFGRSDIWAAMPSMSRIYLPADFCRRSKDLISQPLMLRPANLVGSFFVLRRLAMERFGEFDENFGVGPYADIDFGFRLMQAKPPAVLVVNSYVHHFEMRTVIHVPGFFEELEERNRRYLEAKWGLQPLPRMKDDFEFELMSKRARGFTGPDEETLLERTQCLESPVERAEGKIIACVNVFNDREVLPGCIESVKDADLICLVDGAYEGFDCEHPYSTDGTLEYVENLSRDNEKIRLIATDRPWPSEAEKRSAYFIGGAGDWYLQVDADERLSGENGNGMQVLREHLKSCFVDAHFLPIVNPSTGATTYFPRLFRHQEGLRYDAAHWNLVAGERVLAPDWAAPLPIAGLSIIHVRDERAPERIRSQDDFYKRMHARESEACAQRVDRLRASLTGDPSRDRDILEKLWHYEAAALYNARADEIISRGV